MTFELPNTTAELLLRAAEAVSVLGDEASTVEVAAFIGGSPDQHARPGLIAARELGFLRQGLDTDHWSADALARLLATSPPGEKAVLLRFRLETFEPYTLFRNRLVAGEKSADAARQTCQKYQLSIDPLDAETVLINWGTYCGGLAYGDDQRLLVAVNDDLLTEALAIHENVLAQRDSVQAHIIKNLGVEGAGFATGEILDRLVDSYLGILTGSPPRDALFNLGHALEAFVKKLARVDPAITLPAHVKTLGAVAAELKTQGRLLPKHHALVAALTALRNAADHAGDAEIGGATWALSKDAAFAANHLAWIAIRSILAVARGDFSL